MRSVVRGSYRPFMTIVVLFVLASTLLTACIGGRQESIAPSSDLEDMAWADSDGSNRVSMPAPGMDLGEEEFGYSEPPYGQPMGQMALDRLVIRTAHLTLAVEDTIESTTSVRLLAVSKGGFVFSSTTYTERDRKYAQVTIRIPADRFDETISDLRSAPWVSEVIREESSAQDVSAEFVDNESRLTALEETQRRYLSLLSEADTIDSILRLESELTNVRSQIESIRGRQNYLSELTAFSTISVSLREVSDDNRIEPDDEFSFWGIFESAWDRASGALAGIAEFVVVLLIFTGFFTPFVLLAYLLYRLVRKHVFPQTTNVTTLPRGD